MSNSLQQILARMRRGSVTLGWGAVAAYSRERLNRLLKQQYLTRLRDNSYLPAFTSTLSGSSVGETQVLQGLEFGSPLLSFTNASLKDSRAKLVLNVVKGTVTRTGPLVGSFEITEALGYWLEMEVNLETVRGEVDPYGRVTLNLAKGASFSSNLFEDDPGLNQQLTRQLADWMRALPARNALFELGTVDFSGYDELAPTHFILRTQASPGAQVRSAVNYGDGAVLVFMKLRGNQQNGQLPDENYLYLLPDGDYSATLVLNRDMLRYASEAGLELLARLLFPELNAFVKKEDHTPLDRAMFGNVDPLVTSLTVEPAQGAVVAAGQQQQFVLYDGNGKKINAKRWKAISPRAHLDVGHGTIDGKGLYTAPARTDLGQHMQTVIITAEYDSGGSTYSAAARLLVTSEALLVMPAGYALRPQQHATGFDVWNAGEDRVAWELLEPRRGQLATVGDRQARFVPNRELSRRVISVQGVQATAGEQRSTALVMVDNQPLVALDPPFVPRLGYGASTQLHDVNRIMPNEFRRWRMLAGEGSVTPSGQFTASAQHIPHSNVVTCEVVRNGVVFAAGYAAINETDVPESATWKSLQLFTITVGKSSDGTIGKIDPNGFQQLEVEVTVETQQEDGRDYKLSPAEIATMALFDRSGQMIGSLADNEEGIGSGYGDSWRTSLKANRFVLANLSNSIDTEQTPRPEATAPEDRTIRQIFYLHRRGISGSQVFYAGFQAESGEWFYSNTTSHRNATIEVQVNPPQAFKSEDYIFTRKRVAGSGGDGGGADPRHEDFTMHLVTDDYWLLDYRGGTFYTAEFVKQRESDSDNDVNTSMVRWESAAGNEIVYSYTGYLFQNHGQPEPEAVAFDGGMGAVLNGLNLQKPVASQYEAGLLVIANFRNIGHEQKYARDLPAFKKMSKPLRVQLRDARGNLHVIQIDYLSADTMGHRNVLVHSVPSRPVAGENKTIRLTDRSVGEKS